MSKNSALDDWKDDYDEKQKYQGDINYLDLDEDEKDVRLLPPREGKSLPWRYVPYHRHIGADNKNYNCPKRSDGPECGNETMNEECPICDFVDKLFATGKKDDADLAKALKFKKNWKLLAVDRDDEEGGVKVLSLPVTAMGQIREFVDDGDYNLLWDETEGHDFKIIKDNTGAVLNYKKSRFRPKPTPLSDDVDTMVEWLTDAYDLGAIFKFYSAEEMAEAIGQTSRKPEREEKEEVSEEKASKADELKAKLEARLKK